MLYLSVKLKITEEDRRRLTNQEEHPSESLCLCKSNKVAATPCFSIQYAINDKNNGLMSYSCTSLEGN